jgi:hypothetical protein
MVDCTYTVPDKNVSGDNLYGTTICYQPFINWALNAFDFQRDYWGDGWGLDDPCNTDKPLARTLNAIWLLTYSAEDWRNVEWTNNILHWGRRYVTDLINDLRPYCGDGSANARAWDYWIFGTDIDLYLGFFYGLDVPGRAGTLIHECRHLGGKGHDANFPAGSAFPAGRSGADSSWNYRGAWMFDALYLWWFYADGRRTTRALREAAKQRAQMIIDNAFATHPGFTIR